MKAFAVGGARPPGEATHCGILNELVQASSVPSGRATDKAPVRQIGGTHGTGARRQPRVRCQGNAADAGESYPRLSCLPPLRTGRWAEEGAAVPVRQIHHLAEVHGQQLPSSEINVASTQTEPANC